MNAKNPRLAYREAAVQSASSVELVIMLYDMLIEDIRGAIDALRENNVEKRGEELKHGMLVLQQLQGSLDFERGGEASLGLERFYTMVRGKLMEAHLKRYMERSGEAIADSAGREGGNHAAPRRVGLSCSERLERVIAVQIPSFLTSSL
jgi:flagellar protein FliS